jgi:hypothetical protein
MLEVEFFCPNEECDELIQYECEWENAGGGSEHRKKCPNCGTVALFEIEYSPGAGNVRAA